MTGRLTLTGADDPTDGAPSLDAAYKLKTPQDNQALYRDWAQSYDAGFANAMGYQLPAHVARSFAELGGAGPVLDIGAGTGLLGEHLQSLGNWEIDGLDLSAEMLREAARKGHYRDTFVADLTQSLQLGDGQYGGIVSSGTFTHGHVGPDALEELLRVAAAGALFCLSINAEHFEARGFEAKFAQLRTRITGFDLQTVSIYGAEADAVHANDKGHIACFRKSG